jgi:SOS-response transcriptional repressor LexA
MTKPDPTPDPRAALDRLIRDNGDDYVSISRLLGRNAAYVQQYLKRGSPKRLPEEERGILARYFGVDEKMLGAVAGPRAMRTVPKLAVGASAGAGSLNDAEALAGKIDFDEAWLRKMGVDPAAVSLIRVQGDSMQPTLNDGDDIMVDQRAASRSLKAGVHVLRMDDTLMVKRVAPLGRAKLSVLSDNPEHPSWPEVDARTVNVIGRVVWVGRKL